MFSERQKTILGAAVQEYVRTAEPVASADLVHRYHLPYSPATVRNEFYALDEAGYLAQPHTSAGRIPTDKGYRFFINNLSGAERVPSREERVLRELRHVDDPYEFMRQVSRMLSQLTNSFALAGFPHDALFYKAGIREVMLAPEFSDITLMHEFSALVDRIEDMIAREFNPDDLEEPRTFIGMENPIREARHYGMIVVSCETPFEKETLIALLGPKRMDYAHGISLLKHFQSLLED